MIYRHKPPELLWDTWLLPDGDSFHLFYLIVGPRWGIGHAVSRDLVHWEARDPVYTEGQPGAWDSHGTLTGTTLKHNGLYYMFYGSGPKVGVMTSTDLEHWTKHPENPVLVPSAPHYMDKASNVLHNDWRDPCIVWFPEEKAYEAFLCARQPDFATGTNPRTCIARMRSTDLVHWEAMPPLAMTGEDFLVAEVPDYFELNGWHYLAFQHGGLATRLNDATRERAHGGFYVMSRNRLGPWSKPDHCLLVGSGMDRIDTCSVRTIAWEGGRMAYSFIAGGLCGDTTLHPSFAAPKIVRQRPDGSLWLAYWNGLERLHRQTLIESFNGFQTDPLLAGLGQWEERSGALHGRTVIPLSIVTLPQRISDFDLTCRIAPGGCRRAAVLLRLSEDGRKALSVTLDFELGRLEIGGAERTWMNGLLCKVDDYVRGVLPQTGKSAFLRVILRDEYAEVYLDERWMFTTWIPNHREPGRVGFAVEQGEAVFSDLRVVELEPLP